MQIDLTYDEAEAVREFLRQKIVELDKEINRTDSLEFKRNLQQLGRTLERVAGQLTAAVEKAPPRS